MSVNLLQDSFRQGGSLGETVMMMMLSNMPEKEKVCSVIPSYYSVSDLRRLPGVSKYNILCVC